VRAFPIPFSQSFRHWAYLSLRSFCVIALPPIALISSVV